MRDRPGFMVTPRLTEDVRKFRLMAEADPETGYDDAIMDVLLPDSTINAGFRHIAGVVAFTVAVGRVPFEAGEEDSAVYDSLIHSAIKLMGDPISAPVPAQAFDALALGGVEGGASPRRLHPDLARTVRWARDQGYWMPSVVIIPAKKDLLAPEGEQILVEERAYMQPGMASLIFSTSPLGELNDIYLRWEKSPLEQVAEREGEIMRWARTLIGAQVTETSRVKSAKSDAPRFLHTRREPPPPK